MLVIGSVALQRALSAYDRPLGRTPKDLDVICTEEEMRNYAKAHYLDLKQMSDYKWRGLPQLVGNPFVEFELLEKSESGHMYTLYTVDKLLRPQDLHVFYGSDAPLIYAPLEVLYSIKRAHRHYPRMWKKHAKDRAIMEGLLIKDKLPEITAIREKETEAREGKLKTPSLDKTAEDFFNDKVSNKIFIHDEIHAVMAHREKPMYEYFKKDGAKVACSREKFEELLIGDRMRAVLEEAYVIALERMMIPMLFAGGRPTTADQAFDWAIMRICTNLCSGWFREFATDYYPAITYLRDKNYVEKFLQAYEDGKIQLIGEAHAKSQVEEASKEVESEHLDELTFTSGVPGDQ
jgi:hypothetical protein